MPELDYPILGVEIATFLAPSADKETCNYDTGVLKPPFLHINPKVKGIKL